MHGKNFANVIKWNIQPFDPLDEAIDFHSRSLINFRQTE